MTSGLRPSNSQAVAGRAANIDYADLTRALRGLLSSPTDQMREVVADFGQQYIKTYLNDLGDCGVLHFQEPRDHDITEVAGAVMTKIVGTAACRIPSTSVSGLARLLASTYAWHRRDGRPLPDRTEHARQIATASEDLPSASDDDLLAVFWAFLRIRSRNRFYALLRKRNPEWVKLRNGLLRAADLHEGFEVVTSSRGKWIRARQAPRQAAAMTFDDLGRALSGSTWKLPDILDRILEFLGQTDWRVGRVLSSLLTGFLLKHATPEHLDTAPRYTAPDDRLHDEQVREVLRSFARTARAGILIKSPHRRKATEVEAALIAVAAEAAARRLGKADSDAGGHPDYSTLSLPEIFRNMTERDMNVQDRNAIEYLTRIAVSRWRRRKSVEP